MRFLCRCLLQIHSEFALCLKVRIVNEILDLTFFYRVNGKYEYEKYKMEYCTKWYHNVDC